MLERLDGEVGQQLLNVGNLKSAKVRGFTSWHVAIAKSPYFLPGISDKPYK